VRFPKLTFAAGFFLYAHTAFAVIPNYSHPSTFLGPTIRPSYASWFNDATAYAVMAEFGLKNYRLSGTAGWKIDNEQRLKFSGEYLWQRITIGFLSGNIKEWLPQGALGIGYQYDLAFPYSPTLNLDAFLSHAGSKSLSTITATYLSNGIPTTIVDPRHISGANSYGFAPGVDIHFWEGLVTTLTLNYDNVSYDYNHSSKIMSAGVGGTIEIKKRLNEFFSVDLLAAVRKPFNNYQAGLNWDVCYNGRWAIGAFGAYTLGKGGLVETYNAGINLNYFVDHISSNLPNFKDDLPRAFIVRTGPVDERVLNWVNDPAVYMPEVEFNS
jgi:hypothetical protein